MSIPDSKSARRGKLAFGVEPSVSTYPLRLARYEALAEAVAAFVRERPREKALRLLDVGVGRGRSLRYIEAKGVAHLIDFHGFDIKGRRLQTVYAADRWRLFRGDIQEGTPFESGHFDIVICEQVLEHLDNPAAALDEIARVTKADGLLVLGVPISPLGVSHLRKAFVRTTGYWFGIRRSHVQNFDSKSIKRLVCSQGRFTISDSYGFRIVSGGLFSPLESLSWWYRFNRWLGRMVPSLCTEIQIVGRRSATP